MATPARRLPAAPALERPIGRARASWGEDLVTVLAGLWLMGGAFVDGWAHATRGSTLESFFTPWHGVLYSGFLAAGLWTVSLVYRGWRSGRVGLAAVPVGYELGLVGVFVFGLGGIGDMIWHTVFGIEVGLGAPLSPTHLTLLTGAVLLLTSPLRSAWATLGAVGSSPGWRALLPALLATLAGLSFATIDNAAWWFLTAPLHGRDRIEGAGWNGLTANLVGILYASLMLLAPVLFLLRRWRLPFGSVALLWGVNAYLMGLVRGGFTPSAYVVAAAAAGLVADLLIAAWRPGANRPLAYRAFAFAAPLALWGLHFLATHLSVGEGLPVDVWSGITVMAALGGLALSVLALPPAMPGGAD